MIALEILGAYPTNFRCFPDFGLKPLKALYGNTAAGAFGPLALKAVRQRMIEDGLCRNVVNQRINRIRRMFKWEDADRNVQFSVSSNNGNEMADIIAYYRVSTKKQGDSGLGLEGLEAAVQNYARLTGATIKGNYLEVESGKLVDRPQLVRALAHARRSKATLVVAKLDRLARNVEFLVGVMNSAVEFVACDNPAANRLTLHILAAVSENEAKAISDRRKGALAASKARGALLGSARPGHWEGHEDARKAGLTKARGLAAKVKKENAAEAYTDMLPAMESAKAEGLSFRAIAAKLNAESHTTRRSKPWNPVQVARALARTI